ncbi:hypothetical protein HPP92_009830 [Vanilla planifolia]|uniref:Uncharacterized protein n=1 Tax=Vanilla planifolia TaxID=51239 RepID=A0A835R4Y9_VANPL|nr:hypothetical protein HPP92_009830 [Vanilla planifolia]
MRWPQLSGSSGAMQMAKSMVEPRYHAFCVGFNPELTCESTWFCPRCINNEVQQNSVMFSLQNHGKYAIIQGADTGWTGDPSLLGKVSVSVADAGETAVVVSLIDGKDKMDSRKSLLNEIETELENDSNIFRKFKL